MPHRSSVLRKCGRKTAMNRVDVDGDGQCCTDSPHKKTWPKHLDVAEGEVASDERPVGLEEAEYAVDGNTRLGQRVGDALDL